MPRRVLISFLGTGPLESKETRTYKTANYHLDDVGLGDYPFVSAALKRHYGIDTVLLVGTAHSMWEEVYRWYSQDRQMPIDDDVYLEIATSCELANHDSPLVVPHRESIEAALGNESKVILIKYGITEAEIRENISIILGLQQYLKNGDELIVDVTHSFRSLPMFMMNLLVYLQNVSPKHIRISHIHYGMLEVSRELGYVPILDLRAMMDVNDWITGAYAFSMFGNTYKISQLLEKENKSVAPVLRSFSDAMNLNYLYPMQAEVQKLSGLKNKEYQTDLPQLTITPIVNQFLKTFQTKDEKHPQSFFQYKLAVWQFEHKKYAQAFLTSNDALISYVCETNGLTWDNFDYREQAKMALRGKADDDSILVTPEMIQWFKVHNRCRNGIAHTTKLVELSNRQGIRTEAELSPREIINILGEDIRQLQEIIDSY